MVKAKIIVVTFVLAGLFLIGFSFWAKSETVLTTTSPDSVYKVRITADHGILQKLLGESLVQFHVGNREPNWIASQRLVGYDGSMAFLDRYPSHHWVSNSILHFRAKAGPNLNGSETIQISNNSTQKVRYLRIRSVDIFLLFDLNPGNAVDVEIPFYEGLSWLESNGQFQDGSDIALEGVDFDRSERVSKGAAYCISIETGQGRILSTQVEGRNIRQEMIPRASNGCVLPK